jgi:hypothetical protein
MNSPLARFSNQGNMASLTRSVWQRVLSILSTLRPYVASIWSRILSLFNHNAKSLSGNDEQDGSEVGIDALAAMRSGAGQKKISRRLPRGGNPSTEVPHPFPIRQSPFRRLSISPSAGNGNGKLTQIGPTRLSGLQMLRNQGRCTTFAKVSLLISEQLRLSSDFPVAAAL